MQRGSEPIHWAVMHAKPNSYRILKYMVERGADVNAKTFVR